MKEIKRRENNKGVTLIALIVTVILIFIIAAVGVSAGMETANSIEIARFNDELKLIHARVDVIYEQLKNGEKTEADFGGDNYDERQGIMDRTFNDLNDTEINRGDYKYYTKQSLENFLGIEEVDQSVLINWKTRDVISVEGMEINGVRRYRYEGWHKPNYIETTPKDIKVTASSENNGELTKVTVSVVTTSDNAQISDFTLKYKLEGETIWKIAEHNYFQTVTLGKYLIEVSGNGINAGTTEITLEE